MTRGVWGLIKGGKLKILYNGHDSYPDGLGRDLLEHLDHLDEIFSRLIMVDDDYFEMFLSFNLIVDDTSFDEIYDLYQQLPTTVNIYYVDRSEFINDSIFCEFAYIIDLDKMQLIFYKLAKYETTYDIKDLDHEMIDYIIKDMDEEDYD